MCEICKKYGLLWSSHLTLSPILFTALCTYLTLDICCCLQMNACESRQLSAGIIVIPNTWQPQCLPYPNGKKIGYHRRLYLRVCLHIDHLPLLTVLCTYLTLDICCCLQMNATESRRFSAGICIGSGNQVGILLAKFGLFSLYCVPPKQTSLLSISTTKSSQR